MALLIQISGVSTIEGTFEPAENDCIHDALRIYREVCLLSITQTLSYTLDRQPSMTTTWACARMTPTTSPRQRTSEMKENNKKDEVV